MISYKFKICLKEILDQRNTFVINFLVILKTFDCVNHEVLMYKFNYALI